MPLPQLSPEARQQALAKAGAARRTRALVKEDLKKGVDYAKGKASAAYNLLRYNCTTFAREMFAAATGKSAPSGGLLIDNPNSLHNEIEKQNKKLGLDAEGEQLPVDQLPDKTNKARPVR